jgi:lambda repressor-like predicted transcriptional regulator
MHPTNQARIQMLTPLDRKIELMRRGVTVSELAREIGYKSRGNVSNVIHGHKRNRRIEAAICLYLGVDRDVWFPPRDQAEAVAA